MMTIPVRKTLLMDDDSTKLILKELSDDGKSFNPEKFMKMTGAVCIEDDLFIQLNIEKKLEDIYGC